MEKVKVNIVLEPILGPENTINFSFFQKRIKKKITLPCGVQVNDVCKVIMKKMGCGDLASYAQSVIFLPNSISCNYDETLFSGKTTLGAVKNVIGEPVNIRISAKSIGKNPDGVDIEKVIYMDVAKLLVYGVPGLDNMVTDPVVKDVIEAIKYSSISGLPHETLVTIQKALEERLAPFACQKNNNNTKLEMKCTPVYRQHPPVTRTDEQVYQTIEPSTSEESHLLKSSNSTNNKLDIKKRKILSWVKKKILSNHNHIHFRRNEYAFLNCWYQQDKFPSSGQCEEYAEYLNIFSKRNHKTRITGAFVKSWFEKKHDQDHSNILNLKVNKTY
uniref:Peptidylprolyl isomerase n=1 Tax=Strongyloides venezuelensis TaxID=75913 RepID=A0A0K0FQ96_STRVS